MDEKVICYDRCNGGSDWALMANQWQNNPFAYMMIMGMMRWMYGNDWQNQYSGNAEMQSRMFEVLGISKEDAEYKFGFIINAFKFGAPPHGGLAFGFDRVCALFGGQETIRDYIAFPKNNQGRDVMIDSPSAIDQVQLDELQIDVRPQQN